MVDKHIDVDRYKIKQNETVNLHNIPTFCDIAIEKNEVKQELFPAVIHEMKSWQEKLYAEKKYGLTFVLQAMDAAGKDSTINHVFSELNPSGLFVKSFKEPTSLESSHDYLWRIHKALPARGEIVIFNRSQYEEVIVTRVHQLLEKESFPTSLITNHIWDRAGHRCGQRQRGLDPSRLRRQPDGDDPLPGPPAPDRHGAPRRV